MIETILSVIGPPLQAVAKSFFPDPADRVKALELENAVNLALIQNQRQIVNAAAEVLAAEIEGESWLQRNWRPIVMLTFAGLIVARWLGYTAPGMSEAEALKLWNITEFGLGGYVVSRSVEKIAPSVAQALSKR